MDPLQPLIDRLHTEGRLRVWSLVITAFGDLIQHRGGAMSTAHLGQVLGRIGVEQGALRTALSRLSQDGWVERERDGRLSIYRLTQRGLDASGAAATDIYAPPRTGTVDRWVLHMTLSESGAPEVALYPEGAAPPGGDLRMTGTLDQVSARYRTVRLSPEHRAALTLLAQDLQSLTSPIEAPLDAAAARLLLIHRWRRMVLRFVEPWPDLMPDDMPLRNPRAAVAQAYERLAPAAEAWVDSCSTPAHPIPMPLGETAKRFAGNTAQL